MHRKFSSYIFTLPFLPVLENKDETTIFRSTEKKIAGMETFPKNGREKKCTINGKLDDLWEKG